MKQTIPASLSLLQSIAYQMQSSQTFFIPNHGNFKRIQDLIKRTDTISSDTEFINSPELIAYTQLLFLVGMSMFGGIFTPILKSFSCQNNVVRITWDSGTTDAFTFGEYDEHFIRFSEYYQNRLSSKPQHNKEIPTSIIKGISNFIDSYIVILTSVDKRLNHIIKSKHDVLKLFNNDLNRDLLFILISSLPGDQINSLFIYIQQFFPEDLDVTLPNGKRMKVISLFENPSVDLHYLIDKTQIYLDLYFNTKMPIIRQITKSKTTEFLKECLSNNTVFEHTQANLRNIKKSQIDIRLMLYNTFKTHLNALI